MSRYTYNACHLYVGKTTIIAEDQRQKHYYDICIYNCYNYLGTNMNSK
jgi:hypothetical protein